MIALLILLLLAFPAEARDKIVVNASTGQTQVVPLTPQEEAEADARDAKPFVSEPWVADKGRIDGDRALKALVRVLAKKLNLTEQQILDAIKAELP